MEMDGKKLKVRIFFTAGVLVLGGLALQGQVRAGEYHRLLTLGYRHAFTELTEQMEGLDTALQKGQYAHTDTLLSSLCVEAYSRAAAARMALAELPFSHVELEDTADFLSHVGDYAYAVSKQPRTENAAGSLALLAQASATLTQRLEALSQQISTHPLTLETLLEAEERLAAVGSGQQDGSPYQTVEEEFPQLPALVYDGPFSQHLDSATAKAIASLPQVDEQTARLAAAAFSDRDGDLLTLSSVGDGELPSYAFTLDTPEESLWIEVTRQGGLVSQFLLSRPFGPPVMLPEQAGLAAKQFLDRQGFPGLRETYFSTSDSLCTVSFAAVQDGVLCYPDLVKVTVALDNGEITGFESAGYLNHHTTRTLPTPSLSPDAAQQTVSPRLSVLTRQLVLIPSPGKYEILCYEFKCQDEDGSHVLVYINALTGTEENILLLLEDESGTLAI